jgi:hypothetical protein
MKPKIKMEENPPKRVLQFLRWFCREDYLEEIEGDLTEIFIRQYKRNPRKANWKFAWNVIKYLRPEFLKPLKDHYPMYKNYSYKNYSQIMKLFMPIAFIVLFVMAVLSLIPIKANKENSAEMIANVMAVKQGGLNDIVFSLQGLRGIYYISHITKNDLNADSLSRRLIGRTVKIYYAKPHFLALLSPTTNTIQITELRLGDEVIFSEFK